MKSGGYIPRRSRLSIYPPLFTFPSGDSCIVLPGFEDRFAVAETVTNELDLWPIQEA